MLRAVPSCLGRTQQETTKGSLCTSQGISWSDDRIKAQANDGGPSETFHIHGAQWEPIGNRLLGGLIMNILKTKTYKASLYSSYTEADCICFDTSVTGNIGNVQLGTE